MFKQYVLTEAEVRKAHDRLKELRHISLLCRDAMDLEGNREWYLRAKGYEEAMRMLGLVKEDAQ